MIYSGSYRKNISFSGTSTDMVHVDINAKTSGLKIFSNVNDATVGAAIGLEIPVLENNIAFVNTSNGTGTVAKGVSDLATAKVFYSKTGTGTGNLAIAAKVAKITGMNAPLAKGEFILIENSPVPQTYFSVISSTATEADLGTVPTADVASTAVKYKVFSQSFPMRTNVLGEFTKTGNTLKASIPFEYLSRVMREPGGLQVIVDKASKTVSTAIDSDVFTTQNSKLFSVEKVNYDSANPLSSTLTLQDSPVLSNGNLEFVLSSQVGYSTEDFKYISGSTYNSISFAGDALQAGAAVIEVEQLDNLDDDE